MFKFEDSIMEVSLNKFLDVWKPYHKEIFWFVDYNLDDFFKDPFPAIKDPKINERREYIFEQLKQVQYVLLEIGDENLVFEPMYHWEELKLQYPKIKEIGFKTPFSFLCHWLSLPNLNSLVKDHGFRDALFVSEIYLDLLTHKLKNETHQVNKQ